MNYYNENDKFAAEWLRKLIRRSLIPNGYVDERSIEDVEPGDLKEFSQCHFFAGIGGWARALELSGWPPDEPVWTGSCPCQPFSVAGAGKGHEDKRHLWPEFARLILECAPPIVFGEQVASALGRELLSGVRLDLEEMGYGVGAADLCAAGVGAPHIRQRLWWVAHSEHSKRRQETTTRNNYNGQDTGRQEKAGGFISCSAINNWLADAPGKRQHGAAGMPEQDRMGESKAGFRLGNAESNGWREKYANSERSYEGIKEKGLMQRPWDYFRIVQCLDRKQRRVPEAKSAFPVVADGLPGRVGLLKGAGNSIVPQVASEFISAFLECF